MAGLKEEYVGKILDGNLSANSVNKLTEACERSKIDHNDFFRILDFAPLNRQNEKYIDEFLDSIDKGVYHETAAKVFAPLVIRSVPARVLITVTISTAPTAWRARWNAARL